MKSLLNRKIKVHLFGTDKDEIFTVYEKGGRIGIDWNTEKSPYTCGGEIFTPFETFAQSVIFEDIENGKKYYYSNIYEKIVECEEVAQYDN